MQAKKLEVHLGVDEATTWPLYRVYSVSTDGDNIEISGDLKRPVILTPAFGHSLLKDFAACHDSAGLLDYVSRFGSPLHSGSDPLPIEPILALARTVRCIDQIISTSDKELPQLVALATPAPLQLFDWHYADGKLDKSLIGKIDKYLSTLPDSQDRQGDIYELVNTARQKKTAGGAITAFEQLLIAAHDRCEVEAKRSKVLSINETALHIQGRQLMKPSAQTKDATSLTLVNFAAADWYWRVSAPAKPATLTLFAKDTARKLINELMEGMPPRVMWKYQPASGQWAFELRAKRIRPIDFIATALVEKLTDKKIARYCASCGALLTGRSDAKTCSETCKKRLQRSGK